MQAGLHAIGWGLQRLAILVGGLVILLVGAYVLWVVAIVVMQAFGE